MPSMVTSELVAAIRARTGDSQEDLARRLGVSFATVNAWERGRSLPRPGHRAAIDAFAAQIGIQQGFTVLVVDDDRTSCVVAAGMLAGSAHAVETHTVSNGIDGLLMCGSLRPDLVLLDILMPGIDGFAVASQLHDITGLEHVALVFVTASEDERILARARQASQCPVLRKPLTPAAVHGVLDRLSDWNRERVLGVWDGSPPAWDAVVTGDV